MLGSGRGAQPTMAPDAQATVVVASPYVKDSRRSRLDSAILNPRASAERETRRVPQRGERIWSGVLGLRKRGCPRSARTYLGRSGREVPEATSWLRMMLQNLGEAFVMLVGGVVRESAPYAPHVGSRDCRTIGPARKPAPYIRRMHVQRWPRSGLKGIRRRLERTSRSTASPSRRRDPCSTTMRRSSGTMTSTRTARIVSSSLGSVPSSGSSSSSTAFREAYDVIRNISARTANPSEAGQYDARREP